MLPVNWMAPSFMMARDPKAARRSSASPRRAVCPATITDLVTQPLQLGLVGLGKIARDQHVPAIAATGVAKLVAVADPHACAAGLPCYPDLATMLAAEPGIDAVAMCQPPQARFAAAREALLAGKHVLLEKPPGATLSEVETLVELAKAQGVTVFAAWHSRFAAGVAAARDWIADAHIRSIRIVWKEDFRVWHPGQQWIWQAGGFGVFDPGINALSILTEIVPDRIHMTAAELSRPLHHPAPIAARLTMATSNGVPIDAEFDFRQTGPQRWDIAVEADEGTLLLSHGGNTLTVNGFTAAVATEQEYPSLYRRFAGLVAQGLREVDLAPLQLVADAFLIGSNRLTNDDVA